MVPFSSENIARSASYDASATVPVSEAARATHESFKSHLQLAAATTVNQPARKPTREDEPRQQSEATSTDPPRNESPQNEPLRQDTGGAEHDDGDVRRSDGGEGKTTSENSAKPSDENVERDAALEDAGVIVTTDELRVAIQEVKREASVDSDDARDQVVATNLTAVPLGEEQSKLDTSLATKAQETGDDATEVKRVSSEYAKAANAETPTRRLNPSETNEEVAAGEFSAAAPDAEAAIPDDEPQQASTAQQRHGHRGDISPNQPTHETPDSAPKRVAVTVVETAADTTSENSSQQRQHHQATEGPQPIGNTAAADGATTTSDTPSRFAQHLLARTEDPNARGLSITNADQARFVDRVARAVQATGERGGLRLRLSPPELGSLTLEVKVQGGVVSARVEADTSAARSLLLENLPLLRERLAEHGMRVDQFDVDLTDRHTGGASDGLQQHDQDHEDRPRAKAASHERDEPQVITSETPTKNGNEQLNIIV